MLPFDTEFKQQLLDGWEKFSEDQRYALTMVLWDAYSGLYQIAFEKNTQEALLRGEEGTEKMDKALYDRIKTKTEQEIQQLGAVQTATVDLTSTREALNKIISQNPQN